MNKHKDLLKKHLELVDEVLRQLEEENLRWSRMATQTREESFEHLCRLYDIVHPAYESMQRTQ